MKRIWRLLLILLLTFIALGFSIGSFYYLNKQMNNPFTNWVNVPIETASTKTKKDAILQHFKSDANRKSIYLNNVSGYSIFDQRFYHLNGQTYSKKGRTVTTDSDLLRKVLNQYTLHSNLELDFEDDDLGIEDYYGIIISQKMLEDLGYANPQGLKKLKINNGEFDFYIDIFAVVSEIPNNCHFLCFANLFNALTEPFDENNFIDFDKKASLHFVSPNNDTESISALLRKHLQKYQPYPEDTDIEELETSEDETLYLYTVYFKDTTYSIAEFDTIFNVLNSSSKIEMMKFTPFNKREEVSLLKKPYYLAFNFERLIKIRTFKDYMWNDHQVEVSMSQVESKENFSFVSVLTLMISIILFFFGLVSITLFIINLLKSHLENIKSNLGTFKAFGLENTVLTNIYSKIIFCLMSVGIFSSLIVVVLLNKLGVFNYLLTSIIEGLDKHQSYFNFFNQWILLAILLLYSISIIFTRFTVNQILKKYPGDLIYNR